MGQIKNASSELSRAKNIAATLGVKRAASYLHTRGYSIECALWLLCRK